MRAIHTCALVVALGLLAAARANAAILTGNVAAEPASVDLTTDGNTDWIHWGLANAGDVNRKATGGSRISNYTLIGAGTNRVRLTDSPAKISWRDGSPTAVVNNTPGGVYINNFDGPGRRFQFPVPAPPTPPTPFLF